LLHSYTALSRESNKSAGGGTRNSKSRSKNKSRFVNTDTLQELLICKRTNTTAKSKNEHIFKHSFEDLSQAIQAHEK